MRVDMDQLRHAAHGRWREILPRCGVAPHCLIGRHCPCPGCGGRDRFRFDDREGRGTFICSRGGGKALAGDGFDLLRHVHGCDLRQVAAMVADITGITSATSAVPTDRPVPHVSGAMTPAARCSADPGRGSPARTEKAIARERQAVELWRAAEPIEGTPAEIYLRGRGFNSDQLATDPSGWPETLRWSKDADGRGNAALVAAVNRRDDGLVCAIQRIFLYPDGLPVQNATGAKVKKALGPLRDNAARLSCWPDPYGKWGLAEGIETALAARQLTGIPTWAAVSAGNMANIAPPHWARHAVVFADHDVSGTGLRAASKALQSFRVHSSLASIRVLSTEALGTDVADVIGDAANG